MHRNESAAGLTRIEIRRCVRLAAIPQAFVEAYFQRCRDRMHPADGDELLREYGAIVCAILGARR